MIEPQVTSFSDAPYFHVRKVGSDLITRGATSCCLGHKLRSDALLKPDGIYAEWKWDGQCLIIENDRYGMFPAFYFTTEDDFCVSSSMFKLIEEGASTDIDWAALAVFLRLGFYVGEDTVFKGIRALPPNARLEWKAGQLRINGGYHFAPAERFSRHAAIERYIALFSTSMERRVPEHDNFAVLLSGGRDSRHILLELCERRRPPRFCLTGRRHPPASAQDEKIAALVAAAAGVKHIVLDPPKNEIHSLLDANAQSHMTAQDRGWKLSLSAYLTQTVMASYDGIGGDILSGGSTLDRKSVELVQSGRFADYSRHSFRDADKALRRIIPKAAYQRMDQDAAIARLEDELGKHMAAANPVSSFQFWNRTRRFNSTSPYGLFGGVPTVYSPFLDHDLYTFLSSLPADNVIDGLFHDEAIRVAYPRYRDLPYAARDAGDAPGSRSALFRTCRQLMSCMFESRPTQLVDTGFILPRLVAGLTFLTSHAATHWFIPTAVYLMQVEAIAYKGLLSFEPLESASKVMKAIVGPASRAGSNQQRTCRPS